MPLEEEEAVPFAVPDAIVDGEAGHIQIGLFVGDGFASAQDPRATEEIFIALIPPKAIVDDPVGRIVPFTPPTNEEIVGGGALKPASRLKGIARGLLWHRTRLPHWLRFGRRCGKVCPKTSICPQRRRRRKFHGRRPVRRHRSCSLPCDRMEKPVSEAS